MIEALKAAAPEWKFEQIHFAARRRGAVVEDNFYNKLERLSVIRKLRRYTCVV